MVWERPNKISSPNTNNKPFRYSHLFKTQNSETSQLILQSSYSTSRENVGDILQLLLSLSLSCSSAFRRKYHAVFSSLHCHLSSLFPLENTWGTYIERPHGLQMSWLCEICKGSEPAKSVVTCGGLEDFPSFDVTRCRWIPLRKANYNKDS